MKGGAPNEKLMLKKLLAYAKKVYQIPEKLRKVSDKRKRHSIPHGNILIPVFIALVLQYESFHTVFSASESMERRLKHMIKGRIPKTDAVREVLSRTAPAEIEGILDDMISRVRRNGVQRSGTIGQYKVAAIDGMELFSSTKKSCSECLTRVTRSHETEHFHRSVVCASVGKAPHIVYGQEMLKPRDGGKKDEGELTGGKRLIERLHAKHGHFADIIVADALYLNAPFINTVLNADMDVVIRLKDERRLIFKEAESMFQKGFGKQETFKKKNTEIEAWDLSGFKMAGLTKSVRVVKYLEKHYNAAMELKETRTMWLVTTNETIDYKLLWEIMHKRWDIEENAFHQLKTFYHANHCYCHEATEVIFLLILIAFNLRELYLFRQKRTFQGSGITRKSITRILCDELLLENFVPLLYHDRE